MHCSSWTHGYFELVPHVYMLLILLILGWSRWVHSWNRGWQWLAISSWDSWSFSSLILVFFNHQMGPVPLHSCHMSDPSWWPQTNFQKHLRKCHPRLQSAMEDTYINVPMGQSPVSRCSQEGLSCLLGFGLSSHSSFAPLIFSFHAPIFITPSHLLRTSYKIFIWVLRGEGLQGYFRNQVQNVRMISLSVISYLSIFWMRSWTHCYLFLDSFAYSS